MYFTAKKLLFLGFFIAGFLLVISPTQAAEIYLKPSVAEVFLGNVFDIEVDINSTEKINAAEIKLLFSKDKLEVLSLEQNGSIFSIWTEKPAFSNQEGWVSFSGGTAQGFSGEGKLLTIVARGLNNTGQEDWSFTLDKKASRVLLNDGQGTEDSLIWRDNNFKAISLPGDLPIISSASHPEQSQWYNNPDLKLHWQLSGDQEYSYVLSYDAQAEADDTPDRPQGDLIWMGDMDYKGLTDGVYYFHLKAKLKTATSSIWSVKQTFKAQIDSQSPEPFLLKTTEIAQARYLVFAAQDQLSGVAHYEAAELLLPASAIKWQKIINPYRLQYQMGSYKVMVKAVDKAGNSRIAELRLPVKKGLYAVLLVGFILLIVLIGYLIRRREKN